MQSKSWVGTVTAIAAVFAMSASAMAFSDGPPPELTGGPADIGSCIACHAGGPGAGSLQILGLPSSYMPNEIYDITVLISDPAQVGAGFQISAQDNLGGYRGNLLVSDAVNTQFANVEETYVTHTEDGYLDSVATWDGSYAFNVQWQAPATAEGPVTFYAVGNAVNDSGNTLGDNVYLTNLTVGTAGIPTVSEWGMVAMALLVTAAGTVVFTRRRAAAA